MGHMGLEGGGMWDGAPVCGATPPPPLSWGPKAAVGEGSPTAGMGGVRLDGPWPMVRRVAVLRVDPTEQ